MYLSGIRNAVTHWRTLITQGLYQVSIFEVFLSAFADQPLPKIILWTLPNLWLLVICVDRSYFSVSDVLPHFPVSFLSSNQFHALYLSHIITSSNMVEAEQFILINVCCQCFSFISPAHSWLKKSWALERRAFSLSLCALLKAYSIL